jgi:hypothetical protein
MVRLAVWSGPRNVSTALLRSFEARGDCEPVDEPLYAAFLTETGKDHPGRDAILAVQPADPRAALAALQRPGPLPLRYEKHMAHHWRPGWDPGWFGAARHAFLIRDPARVVASYAKVREAPLPEDLGYDAQLAWLRHVTDDLGQPAVVVDGDALLADPAVGTRRLCAGLGIPWTERMLRWPPGRRATDGVWAPHWYAAVEASTGFGAASPPAPVPTDLRWVVAAVTPAWEALRAALAVSDRGR